MNILAMLCEACSRMLLDFADLIAHSSVNCYGCIDVVPD